MAQPLQEMTLCCFCQEPLKILSTFTGCKHQICGTCSSRVFHVGIAGRCPWCCLLHPMWKDGEDKGRMDGEEVGSKTAKTPKELCQEHQEALEMFCMEDQSLICWRCTELQVHRAHATVPLQEAAEEYKTKLEKAVKLLQKQQLEAWRLKSQEEKKLAEWKNKTSRESEKIKKEFEKMHSLLDEEEEELQKKLKREKKSRATKLRNNITQMMKQSQALGELIDEINKKCQQSALGLLKDADNLLSRSREIPAQALAAVPEELRGMYDIPSGIVFEFLKRFKVDMTLDPASAHPRLLLFKDGRSVSHGGVQQDLLDHPERFDPYVFVLGSLRITSGRCYWEVEVGDKTEWDIGVCREAVKRKGKGPISPPAGFWRMWLRNGNQYKVLLSHPITLSVQTKPRRVGIYLDYKGGEVTFYNATDKTHLYTYSGAFTSVLRPFFSPGLTHGGSNAKPLVVCPAMEQE